MCPTHTTYSPTVSISKGFWLLTPVGMKPARWDAARGSGAEMLAEQRGCLGLAEQRVVAAAVRGQAEARRRLHSTASWPAPAQEPAGVSAEGRVPGCLCVHLQGTSAQFIGMGEEAF